MATPEEEEDVYLLGTFDDVQGFRVPPPRSAMGHEYVAATLHVYVCVCVGGRRHASLSCSVPRSVTRRVSARRLLGCQC